MSDTNGVRHTVEYILYAFTAPARHHRGEKNDEQGEMGGGMNRFPLFYFAMPPILYSNHSKKEDSVALVPCVMSCRPKPLGTAGMPQLIDCGWLVIPNVRSRVQEQEAGTEKVVTIVE